MAPLGVINIYWFRLVTVLLLFCSCELNNNAVSIKIEARHDVSNCSQSFVLNTRSSYAVFQYDEQGIWQVGSGHPPGALEQVSLDCKSGDIIATFNLYGRKGLSNVENGIYFIDKAGLVKIVPIKEVPYLFEKYGDTLIVDTGALFPRGVGNSPSLLESPDKVFPNEPFSYLLQYDIQKKEVVEKYPYGGPTPLFLKGQNLYAFDVPSYSVIKIDLENQEVVNLFHTEASDIRMEKYAVSDEGRLFMLVADKHTTVVYPESNYKSNTLYEIIGGKVFPLLDMEDTRELIAVDDYIYVFTYGEGKVCQYSLKTKKKHLFSLPFKYLNNITYDGKSFVFMTGPGYLTPAEADVVEQNTVHVSDIEFKNIRSLDLPYDAVGISVPRHGSGGQS